MQAPYCFVFDNRNVENVGATFCNDTFDGHRSINAPTGKPKREVLSGNTTYGLSFIDGNV